MVANAIVPFDVHASIQAVKQCTRCGQSKPANRDNFPPHKHTSDKLDSWCRQCRNEYRNQRRANNRESEREMSRQYRANNREVCIERTREWRANNPEYHAVKAQEWRENHPGQSGEYAAIYRQLHPDYQRQWAQANPVKVNLKGHRYRTRRRELPYTFTEQDWRNALDYFGGCAVCGRTDKMLAMDHWIPLTSESCPGTIASNIVPLCQGRGGCNNSKLNKLPEVWLAQQFDEGKTSEILNRVRIYFERVANGR